MYSVIDLFPQGTISYQTEKSFEINGLKKNTQPKNCEIIKMVSEPLSNGDRRDYYLVLTKSEYVFFRICTAYPNSGYDEFAVGHGAVDRDSIDAGAFVNAKLDMMQRMS